MSGQTMRRAEIEAGTGAPLLAGSVGDRLREVARRFGGRDAVLWEADGAIARLDHASMLEAAERVAAWLVARVRPGERVAVWSRNSLDWILLEYGCALAGAVIVAWNTAWTDPECERARDLVEPSLLFAGSDTRGVPLLARAERLCPDGRALPLEGLGARVAGAPRAGLPRIDPDAPFLLQYTSGTTGHPRAAILTHAAALNAAWLRARLFGAAEDDVWLNPVPLSHVGGAVAMLLGAMATGGAYVLMPRFDAAGYARVLDATGATRIGGVPTMLLGMLDLAGWRPPPSVRSIGLGGTQVPVALIERLAAAFGAPVVVTYGQSECPLIASTVPGDPAEAAARTVGRAAPHVALRIVDPRDGRARAPGEVGEVRVRAPTALRGYHGAPAGEGFDAAGWLCTGDLGSLDEQGFLRIHGRAREVVIRGGENVYPVEVEEVLSRHPDVAQVAVIGIPDARWGQVVGAVVVARPGAAIDPPALEAMAAGSLAHFKVPRRWRVAERLPMTASGKVRKLALAALFEGGGA